MLSAIIFHLAAGEETYRSAWSLRSSSLWEETARPWKGAISLGSILGLVPCSQAGATTRSPNMRWALSIVEQSSRSPLGSNLVQIWVILSYYRVQLWVVGILAPETMTILALREFFGNMYEKVRCLLWLSGKKSACQCRRHQFDPWVGTVPWRRKWQTASVFLPGKSHGQRSLVGYSSWGRKESDMTATKQQQEKVNSV